MKCTEPGSIARFTSSSFGGYTLAPCLQQNDSPRVPIVEDEPLIADFIARGLSENGYTVEVCHDGEEPVHWPDLASFDVIVLDVLLPSLDGIGVCRALRKRGVLTPVLMVTARDSVSDRRLGLMSGANDRA